MKTMKAIGLLSWLVLVVTGLAGSPVSAQNQNLVFESLQPCVVFDTRSAVLGAMFANEVRDYNVVGSTSNFVDQGGVSGGCGIPGFTGAGDPQVQAVLINLVAIDPAGGGNLKAWAADQLETSGGVVNYQALSPAMANSNAVAVEVRQDLEGDDISVRANGHGVDVRGVVLGYFHRRQGSFSKSIRAIACTAQGNAPSGDQNNCSGAGTVRTDGDDVFPCVVHASSTRSTYACHVDLPSGALIDEVIAYGWDSQADGYFEAAIWRSPNTSFGINYFSPTFGGTWQSSGLAATPGPTSFSIYLGSDPPHTVLSDNGYVIGFATKKATGGNVWVHGFRIEYTIP